MTKKPSKSAQSTKVKKITSRDLESVQASIGDEAAKNPDRLEKTTKDMEPKVKGK